MPRLVGQAAFLFERVARNPSGRFVAGLVASIAKSVLTGSRHRISYDARGWWTNQQKHAVFFSPSIHTGTLKPLSEQVDDFWCYQAQPGSGDVVVDVGAGTGDHVLVFSRRVGSQGLVIAIEAHPATAQCLKLTVERNGLENTRVIEEAAWDRETVLSMSDDSAHEANSIGLKGSLNVPARPVDVMLAPFNLDRVDLLKINIEGAEVTALAGMRHTLARTTAVVVSCHDFLATRDDDPRRTKTRIIPLLKDSGFVVTTRPDAPYAFLRDYVYGRRA